MKICIFGSSFNPPHLGHLQIVEGLKQLDFDRVLIVPTGNPNHKQIEVSTEDRMAMIKEFVNLCKVEVSFHEIENNFAYTVESLAYLNFAPSDQVYFTIGSDSVNSLPTWDYFEQLKSQVIFVVVNRPGVAIDQSVLEQINYLMLDVDTADVSSSQLRKKLDRELIPESIFKVICERHLYRK